MGKVRIHELAKRLNMTNQELIAKLNAKGVLAKTHSSNVDEASALKALEQAKSEAATLRRPRTVLRRRRKEEPEAEQSEAKVIETPQIKEPEAEISPKPFEVEKPALMPEHIKETTVQQKEQTVAKEQEKPAQQEKKPIHVNKNVVRVIDADSIKARLASEGRVFRPRSNGFASRNGRRPSNVREVRISTSDFNNIPKAMPDTSLGQAKPGARASKRKGGTHGYTSDKEKREMKSGGYELWLSPSKKRKKGRRGEGKSTQITQAAAHKRVLELSGPITVNDLAHKMSIKSGQVVTKLMGMGMMVTVNQPIDPETAAIVASEFEYEIKNVAFEEIDILKEEKDVTENLKLRAPIVTVMGHVDHGKTSLLDALRKTDVVKGEAGGITQHIGAYSVNTNHGKVTFLDTPGHEAFTSMRARGAEVTDIVVLVVAADDGVMPQTKEAISHAKSAKVPLVVAINKMDSANAKAERVMQQLSEHDVVAEEWGGDVQMFKVSALKKQGLIELMDGIAMQAEMMELKADACKRAVGSVVEAKLDRGRGPVATVLIKSGTLKQGDDFVAGEHAGRIRAMYDSNGEKIKEAGPSDPVQILGISGVPTAGDKFNAVEDDKAAKSVAAHRAQKNREKELMKTSRVSLENFLKSSPTDKGKELRLVVKADVFGSAEALVSALKSLSNKQVKVEVIHSGVGTITENDVNLAMASGAIVIGFNTKPDSKAHTLALQEKVDVRSYSIIYEVIDEVKMAMAGLLSPVFEYNYLGKAEVRAIFLAGKTGKIAGCYVTDGKIIRLAKAKVLRNKEELVGQASILSLKRFKDDVKEVTAGYECGLRLEGFSELAEGDIIECFELKEVAAKLEGPTLEDLAKIEEDSSNKESSPSA
ncbi:translation initiation factor IF-2 [Sulfobacillus acidophilus]|uniref:Translation initiation factor IF-2 n=1 Tax=Sulfobacillus acidophilus TaxID=53633 RepID=A0ABS3AYQ4_9FIRM|nr:translation initiation factor IF-2 [Sulfobacillus acidophilus]